MSLFFDLFRHEPRILKLSAEGTLFREGQASDGSMYVLVSGRADILVGERVVEEAGPGAILGEIAMIEDDMPRGATVIARTDCEFAIVDRKRFHFLVSETPSFAIEVMRIMARRLRHCGEMLA